MAGGGIVVHGKESGRIGRNPHTRTARGLRIRSVKLYLWRSSLPLASRRLQIRARTVAASSSPSALLVMGYYILHPHPPRLPGRPRRRSPTRPGCAGSSKTGTPPERRAALLQLIARAGGNGADAMPRARLTRPWCNSPSRVSGNAGSTRKARTARRQIEAGTEAMNDGDLERRRRHFHPPDGRLSALGRGHQQTGHRALSPGAAGGMHRALPAGRRAEAGPFRRVERHGPLRDPDRGLGTRASRRCANRCACSPSRPSTGSCSGWWSRASGGLTRARTGMPDIPVAAGRI